MSGKVGVSTKVKPAASKAALSKKTVAKETVTRKVSAKEALKTAAPTTTDVMISDFAFVNAPEIDIPGMIGPQEKRYFYWLTSNFAPGLGAVVEFGTWLGCSSAYLSAGLGGRQMHCYDQFVWGDHYDPKSAVGLSRGDDFSPVFRANMERVGANVVVHKATIRDAVWDGGPIELLAVDAPKYAAPLVQFLGKFGPSLIPGQSHIAFQDYQHFPAYQIAVLLDAIRDSLILKHVVIAHTTNQPSTVAFFVEKPIDLEALSDAGRTFKTWSADRIHETWTRIMKPLPDQTRAQMAPGLSLFLHDAGHEDAALATLAEISVDSTMVKRWKRLEARFTPLYPALYAYLRENHFSPA